MCIVVRFGSEYLSGYLSTHVALDKAYYTPSYSFSAALARKKTPNKMYVPRLLTRGRIDAHHDRTMRRPTCFPTTATDVTQTPLYHQAPCLHPEI